MALNRVLEREIVGPGQGCDIVAMALTTIGGDAGVHGVRRQCCRCVYVEASPGA